MLRKVFSVFASAVIALGTLSFTPAPVAAAGYSHPCNLNGYREYVMQQRLATDTWGAGGEVGNFKGVEATMVLGAIDPDLCNTSLTDKVGQNVFLITLQQGPVGDGIIQIGLGWTWDRPGGGILMTINDHSPTLMWRAGGGTPDLHVGHRYKFSIVMQGSLASNPKWKLCADDLDDVLVGEACWYYNRTWNNDYWGERTAGTSTADHSWWGWENTNSGDGIAARNTSARNSVWGMKYWRYADSTWYTRTGFTSCVQAYYNPGTRQSLPSPSQYKCAVTSGSYVNDTIHAYTDPW